MRAAGGRVRGRGGGDNRRIESLLRPHGDAQRSTSIELFFDLVYAFAITQLSERLLDDGSLPAVLRSLVLFGMVWLAWVYTTWMTNWLDPDRLPIRVALILLMGGSLVLSAGIPEAFGARGLWIGAAYAGLQVGRSVAAVWALPDDAALRRNFERILAWCVVSGAAAVAGGLAHGTTREFLWLAAVLVDTTGGVVGFATPGLGRSTTADWTIEGNHIADRCQAFVLLALGESIIRVGETLTSRHDIGGRVVVTFVAGFAGIAALWWIYFDRTAEEGARTVAGSEDPGRLGRSAYHFVHPVMIAGIIAIAAGAERVLGHPAIHLATSTALMILGGSALFLLGNVLFELTLWRRTTVARLVAIAVLGLLGLLVPHAPGELVGVCACVTLVACAASERAGPTLTLRRPAGARDVVGPHDRRRVD